MKIAAGVRTLNEEKIVARFIEAYHDWVDFILVADGGSTDGTVDIARSYPKAKVRVLYDMTMNLPGEHTLNPPGKHTNFLIDWATKEGADWFIFDDCDCVPNYMIRRDGRSLMEATSNPVIYTHRVFFYGHDKIFPKLHGGFTDEESSIPWMSLWAWKPKEIEIRAQEEDPLHLGFNIPEVIPTIAHYLHFPYCLLHYTWPSEYKIRAGIRRYRQSGIQPDAQHPKDFAGPLDDPRPYMSEFDVQVPPGWPLAAGPPDDPQRRRDISQDGPIRIAPGPTRGNSINCPDCGFDHGTSGTVEPYSTGTRLLAISHPKCGTMLLGQLLRTPLHVRAFIGMVWRYGEWTEQQKVMIECQLRRFPNVAFAHLAHRPGIPEVVRYHPTKALLLIRDPRDQIVSQFHYAHRMFGEGHVHSFRYDKEFYEGDALLKLIKGASARWDAFLPWLAEPDTTVIRFEDLVADKTRKRLDTVERIWSVAKETNAAEWIGGKMNMYSRIDPKTSWTFRVGKRGTWRNEFKEHHIKAFEQECGSLMEALGYAM